MDWWQWTLLVLLVLGLIVGAFALLQSRRRAGGVIASQGKGPRATRSGKK